MKIGLEFKKEDLWVGVYWRKGKSQLDIWVCLIPCFPIHITIEKLKRDLKEVRK